MPKLCEKSEDEAFNPRNEKEVKIYTRWTPEENYKYVEFLDS